MFLIVPFNLFQEFTVGCFCAERGHIYHELHHLDFEWKKDCIEKVMSVYLGQADSLFFTNHLHRVRKV